MAVYKVPQDVEADDKLLGPLSFRQFIYAVVAAIGCAIAFFLSQLFIGLIIIPLPIIILFTILALPLRKDQPMEMYLIAIIRFMLKPRMRLWQPEGTISLVEIVAPRVVEEQRTNGLTQDQARSQLEYLAQLMDTRGWAAKGSSYTGSQQQHGPVYADSDISNDIMDVDASVARNFDSLLAKKTAQQQQEARQRIQTVSTQGGDMYGTQNTMRPAGPVSLDELITQQQQVPLAQPTTPYTVNMSNQGYATYGDDENVQFDYNPYPKQIHQQVVQPLNPRYQRPNPDTPAPAPKEVQQPSQNTMTTTISPDIMRLATESKNLSISTLANEAHRLEHKQDETEVVVTLH